MRNSNPSLSSSFNERAAPRISDSSDRRYHHRVVPVRRSGAPHYAQASELYPMEASSDNSNPYRYRPSERLDGGLSYGMSRSGQPVLIPVVHLDSNRNQTISNHYLDAQRSETGNLVRALGSPTTQFGGSLPRQSSPRSYLSPDPEAEVDELTNELMRSMETRSLPSGTPTASPAGSIRRNVGFQGVNSTPSPITVSRHNRLQQANSATSMPVNNGGLVSPITASTNSPQTSSPTSSVSSTVGVGDANSQNACFRCHRPLLPPEGSILAPISQAQIANNIVSLTGALSVRLHTACFTCYLCKTPLATNAYYHSLHRLLCPTCVRDGAVESCANCERPIGERVIRALGRPYHPGCFVCIVCNCRLDSKPFTVDVHGRPLCLDDFHKRYAPRCTACSRPIVPEAGSREARRVVVNDSDYHLSCYQKSLATLQQTSNQLSPVSATS